MVPCNPIRALCSVAHVRYECRWSANSYSRAKALFSGHGLILDLDRREVAALAPIMALCLVLGIYPQPVIDTARQDLDIVAALIQRRQQTAPTQASGARGLATIHKTSAP